MEQQSRDELFAELRQRVLASRTRTQESLRQLNEEFERSERRKREIASYYRERRLQRLLRSGAV
jgi:cell shape-determining protein MreC